MRTLTIRQTLLAASQPEPERPKSPWTPSYSVSHQGTLPTSTIEVAPIDAPVAVIVSPQPVAEAAAAAAAEEQPVVQPAVEVPERPWTPSYSVNQQGSSPHIAAKALEEEPVPQ